MGGAFSQPTSSRVIIEKRYGAPSQRLLPYLTRTEVNAREETTKVFERLRAEDDDDREYMRALRMLIRKKNHTKEEEGILKRLRAAYNNSIMVLRVAENTAVFAGVEPEQEHKQDDVPYIAYTYADDAQQYLDVLLEFNIVTERGRKRKGGVRDADKRIMKLGYLARAMSGQKWCVIKPPGEACHIMYANEFVKEVLKWASREQGVDVVDFQPMTQESVNMWKRLARRGEEDEPFATLTTEPGHRQERQQADMELFNLDRPLRICSECGWFAALTYDHPVLKDRLFFCGDSCAQQTWQRVVQ